MTPQYIVQRLRPHARDIAAEALAGRTPAIAVVRAYEKCRAAPRPVPYETRVRVIEALNLWLWQHGKTR